MIDNTRLERNLIAVARRYAPALIPAGWQQPGDYSRDPARALPDLARALTTYNVLVLAGNVPPTAVKAWTDGYTSLYALLANALFPSYTRVTAFYVDQEEPMLVALYGEATPVIVTLGGFAAPYVVARQGTRPLEVEVQGMMDMMLEDLEAGDLPREDYRRLRDSGAAILRGLLEGGARQLPLTPAARPIFGELTAPPAPPAVPTSTPNAARTPPPPPADLPEPPPPPDSMPEEVRQVQPPPTLPETPAEPPASARRAFDPDAVPIFFNPAPGAAGSSGANRPPPPVPPLPPREGR